MVKCLYCDKEFKSLYLHLKKVHNIESSAYEGKLIDDELINKFKIINSGENNPRYNAEVSDITKIKLKNAIIQQSDKRYGIFKDFEVKCNSCGKLFIVNEREYIFPKKSKYFCSISCSNKRIHSETTKQQISNSVTKHNKDLWKNGEFVKKKLKNNTILNSKGEIEIRNYLIDNFTDDGWTYGGPLVYKNVFFTRDIYSEKLKICVEYDGILHFKNIFKQLENKQLKDAMLEEWCIENNYRLIRIKDDLYRLNKPKYLKILLEYIYNSDENVVKIY